MGFWGVLAVNLVISALVYILTPKPQGPKTPEAGKIDVPQPKLGAPIPVLFGEDWIEDGHISYYGNVSTEAIKKKGGK